MIFQKMADGTLLSAREIVPVLIDLTRARSVVDVGCGAGTWLSVFSEHQVEDILGIDGPEIDRNALRIPKYRFISTDLCRPKAVGRRFDLVLSLDIAEYIPSVSTAVYLDYLESLGDIIVFSSAIPNQGGAGRVNEQWPEYWKAHFEARGFTIIDCLRHRIWNNRNVERAYRQNLMLYVKASRLAAHARLAQEQQYAKDRILSVVHPAAYTAPALSALWRMVPGSLSRTIQRRLGRHRG